MKTKELETVCVGNNVEPQAFYCKGHVSKKIFLKSTGHDFEKIYYEYRKIMKNGGLCKFGDFGTKNSEPITIGYLE